jgi:glycosyltransferase involved in cell wall biosynthesis
MQRIAGTMAAAGYTVLLIGRKRKDSIPLKTESYSQERLSCFFDRGFLFYLEYNLRLYFFLSFQKADIICAIDLDTILPVYLVTLLKRQKRVYDAHEIFTEQKEILTRPFIHSIWLMIERFAVPKFKNGYTVNHSIANELEKRYAVKYVLIRNLPKMYTLPVIPPQPEPWFLYQGAVNEGRCFETLIPAMKEVNAKLVICGKGNFFDQTKRLIKEHGVENKVELRGYVSPAGLLNLTPYAFAGITLFEREGMNQYYSLSNRFFDYTMAGIPQLCVNYPEYAVFNKEYPVAMLIDDTDSKTIVRSLNNLLEDAVSYKQLRLNCLKAREKWNWAHEQHNLIHFYNAL